MQDPIKRKALYDYLAKEKMTDLDYNTFSTEYATNPEKQQKLFDYLSTNKMTDLDYTSFSSEYFGDVKKKDSSQEKSATTPSPSADIPLVTLSDEEVGISESVTVPNQSEIKPQVNAPFTAPQEVATTATTKLPTPKKEEKPKEESWVDNLYRQFKTGSADLGEMMASVPESLYNLAALPQNIFSEITGIDVRASADKFKESIGVENKVLDFYADEVAKLEKETENFNKKYDETGIYENIKKGNYQDAFELLGSGITRSAPVSLAMMAGGATMGTGKLAATATPLFMEGSAQELKQDNPEMSEAEVTIKSLGMAGAETLFGSIGTGTLGNVYRGILLKEGKDQAPKIFKAGIIKAYETALKKFGMAASMTGEGIEEVATEITQNLISGKPATQNVADAFLQGIGGGALYGSPLTAITAKNAIVEGVAKNKINRKLKDSEFDNIADTYLFDGNNVNEMALDLSKSNANRKVLEKELRTRLEENTIDKQGAINALKNFEILRSVNRNIDGVELTEQQKKEIAPLLYEKTILTEQTEGKDKSLVSKELDRISEINRSIVAIRNTETSENSFNTLSDEEKLKAKEQASKELVQEMEDNGVENYTINDRQITERAIQNIESQQTETTPQGDFFDINNVRERDVERNAFNPLETEEEAIIRLRQGLEGLEGKERADAIENIAEQHEKSYLDYVATQPNSEEILNSDFAKNFKQNAIDALSSNKEFKATEETDQDNGSRVDEEGNQITEVEFLEEQGKIEPIEDEVSPTVEMNPVNTEAILDELNEINNKYPQQFSSIEGIEYGESPSGKKVINGKIDNIVLSPKDFKRSEFEGQENRVEEIGAENIDLSEPIEATMFSNGEIKVADGHHRLIAALKLGENLKVNLSFRNVPTSFIPKILSEGYSNSVNEDFASNFVESINKLTKNKVEAQTPTQLEDIGTNLQNMNKAGESMSKSLTANLIKQVINGDYFSNKKGVVDELLMEADLKGYEAIESEKQFGNNKVKGWKIVKIDNPNINKIQLEEKPNQQPKTVSKPERQTTEIAEAVKQEPSERKLTEAQEKQNKLVDARNQYNRSTLNKKRSKEGQNLKMNVIQLASDLGFTVGEKRGKLSVTTDRGTEAGKISFKEQIPNAEQADIDYAISEIQSGVLNWDGDPNTPRIDLDMDRADIRKGEADILRGKPNTVPAKRLIQALKDARENGVYEYFQGSGGMIDRMQVPIAEASKIDNELTSEELEIFNTQQEQEALQYDEWFSTLDEKTKTEILDDYENNPRTISENEQSRESQTNDNNEKKPKTKAERIKASNASVDDIVNAIKGFDEIFGIKLKIDDINGIKKNGVDMVDAIASVVKKALEAGIEIDVAIQKSIEHFKKTLDFDVDINDIKAKVNPVKTQSKPQAFTTRSFKAENITEGAAKKLEALGLDYDVESQSKAEANAKKIISELGIIDAYNLAVEGTIRGGARTWIKASMFEELNNQIYDALGNNDLELADSLQEQQAKIMKDFADEQTMSGQEASMLTRIYQRFGMKYDINFAREKWEKKFKSEMPADVEARLKIQEEKIKDYEKKIKELENTIGTLQEQEAVQNLQDVIKRHKNKPSPSSLRTAASALRKAKFTRSMNDLMNLQSDASGLFKVAWDGAIETVARTLESSPALGIEHAVKQGINHITKSEWYKNLKPENKRKAEQIAKKDFTEFLKDEIKIPTENTDVEQDPIKIPSKLIYELVEGGADTIVKLTDAVHEILKEQYPNLTKRDVRDAITGYGKQINETSDVIKQKISKLRIDGKQMSALEDLDNMKPPKRSGRKAIDYTPEQRNRIKEIREKLKNLPFDDTIDKAKYYKTAVEAYKTRLENAIKDYDDAIKKNERIIKEKRNLPLDDDTKKLIEKRKEAKKEYDEHFGKPYVSDETLIEQALRRKEKSLRDLQDKIEYAKEKGKEMPKNEARKVNDKKIDDLQKEIDDARNELNDILNDIGVAEAKRLDRAKKYTERKINEYRERIKNRDFSKRKPKSYKYDKELIDLKKQLIIDKTKYDLEFEKQERKEMGFWGKAGNVAYVLFGTGKSLKATLDFSAMLRQGILLGTRNPVEFAKATADMHKFAFDSKEYKDWIARLESSDDFIYMMEDGLSITDTSGDVLRSEERFVGTILNYAVMVGGTNINVIGRLMEGSERAYGGMLNSLRVQMYRKLALQYEAMGITREEHPKKYRNLAKFVNNASGRGSMTSDKRLAKLLNMFFFSPRMITGMYGVVKDMVRPDSTPYLRKQAATSLMTFIAYQYVMKLMLSQAFELLYGLFDDDDDDEKPRISQDMRITSTDFSKLRIDDTRYDVSSGWGIAARTIARVAMNEKASTIDDETVSFDDTYSLTRFSEIPQFFLNKLSPLARLGYNYGVGAHPTEFGKKREDATVSDYVQAIALPLTIEQFMEGIENDDEYYKIVFDGLLNTYGVGVQTYEAKLTPQEKADKEALEMFEIMKDPELLEKYNEAQLKKQRERQEKADKKFAEQQEEYKKSLEKNKK